MKKFLVVLLSLGLIIAFGATASAADLKFSGSYYVVGWFANNVTLGDETPSSAAFWQRFRLQPVFQIAEGLTLTARWDAMEKGWGSTNWKGGADDMNQSRKETPAFGNPNIQENFEWERGYMTFKTKIGQFDIGYQSAGKWGTDFLDDEKSRPRIKFATQAGPMTIIAIYEKQFESVYSAQTGYAGMVDADNEQYALAVVYNFKGGNAGLLYKFADNRYNRPLAYNSTKAHVLSPYMKATFGPVYIEAEVDYATGKVKKYESPSTAHDVDWDALGAYIKVRADVGPAYFGAAAQYIPGDDPAEPNTKKSFINASGNVSQDLDVGLLLGNDALQTWQANGGNGGANGFKFDSGKNNSIMFSAFGGFNPTPNLNIELTLIYAVLDKIPVLPAVNVNDSKKLGTEIDVTAKYKIYDNLTYMVGAAYLQTGDAFKGFGANSMDNKVGNDYLLLNKMTLSF